MAELCMGAVHGVGAMKAVGAVYGVGAVNGVRAVHRVGAVHGRSAVHGMGAGLLWLQPWHPVQGTAKHRDCPGDMRSLLAPGRHRLGSPAEPQGAPSGA